MASQGRNSKTTRKTKKAAAGKQAPRKTPAKAAKKAKKAKKTKVVKKAKASKKTSRKTAAKKSRGAASKTKVDPSDSVELDVNALDLVDQLLDDVVEEPVKAAAAKTNTRGAKATKVGPCTPSVPRAVKPAPKVADLEMDTEILRFIDAIDKYKQEFSRPFPSWREVFYVFTKLGYTLPK